jgi:hypothetical protein
MAYCFTMENLIKVNQWFTKWVFGSDFPPRIDWVDLAVVTVLGHCHHHAATSLLMSRCNAHCLVA